MFVPWVVTLSSPTRLLPWLLFAAVPSSVLGDEGQAYDCVITPSAIVEVSSAVAGVLERVRVDRSDRVRKGQLLAQLDSSVEIVERDLAKARADTDVLVRLRAASLRFDNRSLHRLSELHGDKLVSAQDKDEAEREATLASWRLRDAQDVLAQRQLELQRAESVLVRRQVRSPIDGIVVKRLKHPGEYVEEQAIVQIAQLDPLYVETIVPMSEFGRIQSGTQAIVTPEIQPDRRLDAEVVVVDGMGDAASGTFGVRFALPNPEHNIPAGVKCRVKLQNLAVTAQALPESELPAARQNRLTQSRYTPGR